MIAEAFDRVDAVDVSRFYGRRRALSHLTVSFRAGEIVGLLGPNGAGKSTLLAILSTLARPSAGHVRYGDRGAPAWGDGLRSHIGVLGHDLFLYGDLTAAENLEFFARLFGVPDAAGRVREGLAFARLEARAGDRVGGFSRGLRQRLALERALLHRPRLLLLDEPFTGLDDESAAVLVDRLRGLRTQRTIVVMATHDFETAEGLVDRALCLTDGRAVELDLTVGAGSLRSRYRAVTTAPPMEGPASAGSTRASGGAGLPAGAPSGGLETGGSGSDALSAGLKTGGSEDTAAPAPTPVLRAAWAIARKDLVVEARSRELLYTTVFFAMACVLVFSFSFVRDGRAPDDAAGGILWVAIVFAGTLALGRAFERERQNETLRALLLAPVERASVYLGKLFGLLMLMAGIELLLMPVIGLLFGAPLGTAPLLLAGLLAAGTIGFAAVGTLLAAMLVRAHSRDVLLPILLYPITVPVIIAGVRGTSAILGAEPDLAMARTWLSMLVFFDAVFVTLALWLFAPVMAEQ